MKINVFLVIGFFSLALGCGEEEVRPSQLLTELSGKQRFASTDQLAGWLIDKDPGLLLVDVRTPEEFAAFSLPGAINIPLANMLSPVEQAKLDCEKHFLVFFSNGTVLAEKAWMINRRNGCTNSRVLFGGLNEWTATILNPREPLVTAPGEEWDLYQLRKAASLYFAGGSKSLEAEPFLEEKPAPVPSSPAPGKKTVPLQPKKVEAKPVAEEEEGC